MNRSPGKPLLTTFSLLACLVLAACGLLGGSGGGSIDFELRRETPIVQAGSAQPLSPVEADDFLPFPEGNLAETDFSGEALLQAEVEGGVCRIFLLKLSGLRKSACPGSALRSGNTSCLEEGSAVFSRCSDHILMTPSGQAQLVGTWVAALYMPRRQMTILMVYEGQAQVQPVTTTQNFVLDSASTIGPQSFWYSVPDVLMGDTPNVPARQQMPLDQMPDLIAELGIEAWVQRIQDLAQAQNIPSPASLQNLPSLPSGISWFVGGGPFANQQVIQAAVQAVPFQELITSLFGEAGIQVDTGGLEYNPQAARRLLTAAGLEAGFEAWFAVQQDDAALLALAQEMGKYLEEAGIRVQFVETNTSELRSLSNGFLQQDRPVLWLARR